MGYDLPKDWKVCAVWWGEGEEIGVGKGSNRTNHYVCLSDV